MPADVLWENRRRRLEANAFAGLEPMFQTAPIMEAGPVTGLPVAPTPVAPTVQAPLVPALSETAPDLARLLTVLGPGAQGAVLPGGGRRVTMPEGTATYTPDVAGTPGYSDRMSRLQAGAYSRRFPDRTAAEIQQEVAREQAPLQEAEALGETRRGLIGQLAYGTLEDKAKHLTLLNAMPAAPKPVAVPYGGSLVHPVTGQVVAQNERLPTATSAGRLPQGRESAVWQISFNEALAAGHPVNEAMAMADTRAAQTIQSGAFARGTGSTEAGYGSRAQTLKGQTAEVTTRSREQAQLDYVRLPAELQNRYTLYSQVERDLGRINTLFRPGFVGKGFQSYGPFTSVLAQMEAQHPQGGRTYVPGAIAGALRQWIGSASPEEVEFRMAVADLANTFLYARSGAQINEAEFQRNKKSLVDLLDEPATFLPRLRALQANTAGQLTDILTVGSTPAKGLLEERTGAGAGAARAATPVLRFDRHGNRVR